MAKYFITVTPDVETIVYAALRTYFFEEVKFATLFEHFGNLTISGTHPFARLMEQEQGTQIETAQYFPSVTGAVETDTLNTALASLSNRVEEVAITASEIADIKAKRNTHYLVTDEDLLALEELIAASSSGSILATDGMETSRRSNFVFEIWSQNPEVRGRIFDLMALFLTGSAQFEKLHEAEGIMIQEGSVNGQKSGIYNYDFGQALHGAVLRCDIDYSSRQYVLDTSVAVGGTITHSIVDITT
ncbi:hypothetical protein CMI37_03160 [Candidatus Pacearchaeota archaeon]|nr:hypothetical protein [Candidatus Pacearchaeota archaeon]|tara:strand:+ start:87 stop:821 length:735 start_codon:yes stop_codon:yes gene_type:complete